MKQTPVWIAIALVTAACGSSDSTSAGGAGYEEFIVAHFASTIYDGGAPTIITVETVEVRDTGNTTVQGALVRFHATSGTVQPAEATSVSGGFAEVVWTVTGQAGHTENLTACASNSATQCGTYRTVATLVF